MDILRMSEEVKEFIKSKAIKSKDCIQYMKYCNLLYPLYTTEEEFVNAIK